MQLYVIITLPYIELVDNVLQVFNESGLIVLAISYFFFTDMTFSIESKQSVGKWLMFAVIAGVGVNSGFILYDVHLVCCQKKEKAELLEQETKREEIELPDRSRGPRDDIFQANYNTTSQMRNTTDQPLTKPAFGRPSNAMALENFDEKDEGLEDLEAKRRRRREEL